MFYCFAFIQSKFENIFYHVKDIKNTYHKHKMDADYDIRIDTERKNNKMCEVDIETNIIQQN